MSRILFEFFDTGSAVQVTSIPTSESFGLANVSATQFVNPVSVSSSESFGSARIVLIVSTSSISSSEAFGTPELPLHISPIGITTSEVFGVSSASHTIFSTGIISSESFGTASILSNALFPSSVASSELFGTASVVQSIFLTGISSTESFGLNTLALLLQPSGINSTEAFGSPAITLSLFVTAIPSTESFGAGNVVGPIIPTSISSLEVFGNTSVRENIVPSSISSLESFGLAFINLSVQLTSITSTETFGLTNLQLFISPISVPSTESFGTLAILTPILPVSIPSSSAFGIVGLTHLLHTTSIASFETFGSSNVVISVRPTSISSNEIFGATNVIGPINVPSLSYGETFGHASVFRFIDAVLYPTSAALDAGQQITLIGSALNMSPCMPDIRDGTIDNSIWDIITSGSGLVTESIGVHLDTGSMPGSYAGVRTIEVTGPIDVEILVNIDSMPNSNLVTAALVTLRLFVNSLTHFDLSFDLTEGERTLNLRSYENGQIQLDRPLSRSLAGGRPRLRLLRYSNRVFVFVGARLVLETSWVTDNASIEVIVSNDPVSPSRVVSTIQEYTRNPVVVFGNEPMTHTIARSDIQVVGTLPTPRRSGPVDVSLYGCISTDTLTSGFTYTIPSDRVAVINEPGNATMTVLSDDVVRR